MVKKANTQSECFKAKISRTAEDGKLRERFPTPQKAKASVSSCSGTKASLLEMPLEIRMQIYDYIWPGGFFAMTSITPLKPCPGNHISAEISWSSGLEFKAEFHAVKGKRLTSVKSRSPLYKGKSLEFKWRAQHPSNTGLLLSCKQLCLEFCERVYSTSIFAFGSSKKVRKFLDGGERSMQENMRSGISQLLPSLSDHKRLIKSFYLELPSYSQPSRMAQQKFVVRFYNGWTRACQRLISETNIQDVAVSVNVPHDRPYRLSLNEAWVQPLLQFCNANITSASVKLISPSNDLICNKSLEAFAEVLRRKILGWSTGAALEAISSWKAEFSIIDTKDLTAEFDALEKWNGLYSFEQDMSVAEQERLQRRATVPFTPSVVTVTTPTNPTPMKVNHERKRTSNKRRKPRQNPKLTPTDQPTCAMSHPTSVSKQPPSNSKEVPPHARPSASKQLVADFPPLVPHKESAPAKPVVDTSRRMNTTRTNSRQQVWPPLRPQVVHSSAPAVPTNAKPASQYSGPYKRSSLTDFTRHHALPHNGHGVARGIESNCVTKVQAINW